MKRTFRLGELLATTATIGIVGSFVAPSLVGARDRALEVRALSELRSLAVAEEAYFAVNGSYAKDPRELPGFSVSRDLRVVVTAADDEGFRAEARDTGGRRGWAWDSRVGGPREIP